MTIPIVILIFISAICDVLSQYNSNLDEPFFRSDYKYVGSQDSFYKVHTMPKKWRAALSLCTAEGSQLVYPKTEDEAVLVTTLMNKTLPQEHPGIWVGAHDIFTEGVYVDSEGADLSSVFSNWSSGEPNDAGGNEDCIAMLRNGKLNDSNCESRLPFMCKKLMGTLTSNPTCSTADLAYVPNTNFSSCYKVHTNPKNWHDAYATCHVEQSYLTVLNSAEEAKFLKNLLQKTCEEKTKVKCQNKYIGVGFHDLFNEGLYLTIHGQTLEEAGYEEWQCKQPNNNRGSENCGSMTRQGKLNDISCDVLMLFICEREIIDANIVDIFARFQTPVK